MSKEKFTYDIVEIVSVLSEKNNWAKVLMRVSWNEGPIVYDIRNIDMSTLDTDNVRMGKGVSLNDDEIENLLESLIEQDYGDVKKLTRLLKKRNRIFKDDIKIVNVRRL